MKKQTFAAALAAVILCAGCSNNAQSTTTTAAAAPADTTTTTAETAAETTESAAETTDAPAETTAAETDGSDSENKTVIFTDKQGHNFYREDAEIGEWGQISFPYGYMRLSTGAYHDSDSEPDLFIPDEFIYNGETAPAGDLVRFDVGDTVGTLTLKNIKTSLNSPWDDALGDVNPDAESGFMYSRTEADFDGEITLTGVVRYYFDELYTISSGDIKFIPDSCYTGLPMATDISDDEYRYGTVSFDEKSAGGEGYETVYAGGLCLYSDAHQFGLGNLKENYSDRAELYQLFDGGNENVTKRVQVTISDVHIEWNDSFGSAYSCRGVIKDISEIG